MGVCEKYMVKGMIKAGATKEQVVKCRKCKGEKRRYQQKLCQLTQRNGHNNDTGKIEKRQLLMF